MTAAMSVYHQQMDRVTPHIEDPKTHTSNLDRYGLTL